MLTYVINTSENKTFDSDLLFELAGYNKIRWMHCSLSEVEECAKEIYSKQNTLDAEAFRIAVLVDFYCFDRVRKPYGGHGYHADPGVDLCIYYPFLEAYLSDHLFDYLERLDLHPFTCEVYYMQNEKGDRYEHLANRDEQVKKILSPAGTAVLRPVLRTAENGETAEAEEVEKERKGKSRKAPEAPEKTEKPVEPEMEEAYATFRLYCTPTVSLSFAVSDYPYQDGAEMSFDAFCRAFFLRSSDKNRIISHTYVAAYGGGSALAAFDTLALSLYLIRMYEREEDRESEGDFEIDHLDPVALKDALVRAWNKIRAAQDLAKESNCEYYSLDFGTENKKKTGMDEGKSEEELLREYRARVKPEELNLSADELYRRISAYATHTSGDYNEQDRKEFDAIMLEYLEQRDTTREEGVKNEFDNLRVGGVFTMVKQCPSKLQYETAVKQRQDEISELFHSTLRAEYIKTDYSDAYDRAHKLYAEYQNLRARMSRNIIFDTVALILTLVAMILPYHFLQGTRMAAFFSLIQYGIAAAIFFGIFIFSFVLVVLPVSVRMKNTRAAMQECLRECLAKHQLAFSAIKRRYSDDLFRIEQIRYEIRQIGRLQGANIAKNNNVNQHRDTLESVENRLSAILNNLGVEPTPDPYESVDHEFDIQRPIRAAENRVYKVFSIEAIESMFPRKGGNA